MATAHALGIAEIVAQIVRSIGSRADLARCCRINRLWYAETIARLWEVAPSCLTLIKLHNENVLGEYLRFIRKQSIVIGKTYTITRMTTTKRHFDAVLDARLCERMRVVALNLDVPVTFDTQDWVSKTLQPCLRILHLRGGRYGDHLFTLIEEHAPRLKVLMVAKNYSMNSISKYRELQFVQNMSSLVYYEGLSADDEDGDILRQMLLHKDITRLSIRLNGKTEPILLQAIQLDFLQSVRSLSVAIEYTWQSSLHLVLRCMTGLQSLSYTGKCNLDTLIQMLYPCPQLLELSCSLLTISDVDDESQHRGFATLGEYCPALKTLQISFTHSYPGEYQLKDGLCPIAKALPHLERLSLDASFCLEDLMTLHTSADLPKLQQLKVSHSHVGSEEFMGLIHSYQTLRKIRSNQRTDSKCGPVRFPNLQFLDFGSTSLFTNKKSGEGYVDSVIDWFLDAMPKLCSIKYAGFDDIGNACFARLEAKIQQRPQLELPSDVNEDILHDMYREEVRQLARQGDDYDRATTQATPQYGTLGESTNGVWPSYDRVKQAAASSTIDFWRSLLRRGDEQ